jgi:uridine kinase
MSMIIGISGGTGSGKTTVANRILASVSAREVVFIQQDSYYRNLTDLPLDFRGIANFDHPDALDNELLVNHVRRLKAGEPIELPLYDFKTHSRLNETRAVEPKPIVIVEGILIFADPRLLEQMDIKVFVDTPDDIRFIRRLGRDLAERGRTVESVIEQYLATVRPMHMQFVEPSKRHADVIIPEGGHNLVSIDLLSGKIRERLANALATVGGQR